MARVLLLESDMVLAEGVTEALRRGGHSVDWQVDPQAATYSADRCRPDIIITDLLLAGRTGVEFLYELRSYPDWRDLPVIVFSDVRPAELGLAAAGLDQLGVSAYHHKSSTRLDDLAKSVDGILRHE